MSLVHLIEGITVNRFTDDNRKIKMLITSVGKLDTHNLPKRLLASSPQLKQLRRTFDAVNLETGVTRTYFQALSFNTDKDDQVGVIYGIVGAKSSMIIHFENIATEKHDGLQKLHL